MEREVSMNEISDGKLYSTNDMVRAGCNDCKGCSACCQGMGNSIVLDPYDICRLTNGTGFSFEQLLATKKIELNVVDGLILPNLAVGDGVCGFLNEEGRCSIHQFRPGICRLFPLGRIYENGSFSYFLQVNECKNKNRSKVKIKQWVDTPHIEEYEDFICKWHYFAKDIGKYVMLHNGEEIASKMTTYFLNLFYIKPYSGIDNFYNEFNERYNTIK